ncbi:sialin-like [Diprion similis]|uniref:sialin-like n=1 Tax=Diprion similis TaxID=362088 RepID=UPI001EF77563|nr:sialin-like [Diprion similis]
MFSSWKLCCSRVPQRWVFAIMGCLALANSFCMRISLSIGITEMAKPAAKSNITSRDETCPALSSSSSTSSLSSNTYDWDEYTQGIILSSFFWGSTLTPIPGGILADKFGGKYVLGIGILSQAIFTMLTPLVVEAFDATGLIVLRILIGFGAGTTFPALFALTAQWAPPEERSKISTVVTSGMQAGTLLGTSISGVLIQNSSMGWPVIFYFFGTLGVVWFLAWILLCSNHPDSHPFISDQEKKYLHDAMVEHTQKETGPTPWRQILTSVPMWALIVVNISEGFGFNMISTDLPKYMSSVLKFSIQANGVLSALPMLAMWLSALVASWFADWLIAAGKMSRTRLGKVFTTVGIVGPAVFLVTASYAGCDRTLVVTLFTASVGMMGIAFPGAGVNTLDLSPNYSGSLTAITKFASALAGIAAPYVVGVITPNQTLEEWRIVFWITCILLLVSNSIYVIWMDGEVQYWNDPNFGNRKIMNFENEKQVAKDQPSSKQRFRYL